MSEDNRHIDDLFRSGLTGQETVPPPELWKKINKQLASRKRSRIISTFLRIAAGVAILLGFGGSLIYYLIQDSPGDNYLSPETVTIPMSGPESAPDHSPFSIHLTEPLSGFPAGETDLSGTIAGNEQSAAVSMAESVTRAELRAKKVAPGTDNSGYHYDIAGQPAPLNAGRVQSLSQHQRPRSLVRPRIQVVPDREERLIAAAVNDHLKRWQIGIMTAPNYSYRSISGGPDKNLNRAAFNSSETGLVSITSKIAVNYRLNERLAIQSGIEIVNMGQITGGILYDLAAIKRYEYLNQGPPQHVPVFQNSLGTVKTDENMMLIAMEHDRSFGDFWNRSSRFADNSLSLDNRGAVIQELYYVQTPVVLNFKLVKGKSNLFMNAGMGVNFLAGNKVTYEHGGKFSNLGRTPGIRNISVSAIAGAGLERFIGNNTSLVVEPRLSHFVTSVSQVTEHRHLPWSVSVSGGIYHRF